MTSPLGSLAQQLAVRLRAQILSGEREPGSRIPIGQVAAEFGTSPIPVRDAIRILEAEGLLERAQTNRVVVAEANAEKLQALFDLRRWVELPAARRAAERLTSEDRSTLRRAWTRLDELTRAGEWPSEAWKAHEDFHRAMVRPAGNAYADRTLDLVYTHMERYSRLFEHHMGPAGVRSTHADHSRQFAACMAGKGTELSDLLADHIDAVERIMVDALSVRSAGTPRHEVESAPV